jgi:hypothetical protein
MSTLKTDAIEAATGTNTDLSLDGKGSGVPDLGAGFKVGGSAGVPTASIQDDAVTLAKLASGTDGVIITYDASGNPVHVGPGTDGQVLTSTGAGSPPAFEDAGGGGAWASITTTAITATASIAFTGFAAGTYSNYQIWVSTAQPVSTNDLYFQTSTDGGSSYDSGASDYEWSVQFIRTASADVANDTADSEIQISGNQNVSNSTNHAISAVINIYLPEEAQYTYINWTAAQEGGADWISAHGAGQRLSAADVDAVKFFWDSGNFVAKGQIQLLGMAN